MPQALAAAQAIDHERCRARVLTGLAPHLPDAQQPEIIARVLETTLAISIESHSPGTGRAEILNSLAKHLPDGNHKQLWQDFCRTLATIGRPNMLESIVCLANKIAANGGGEAVVWETFEAIRDVSKWWL